MKRFLLPLCLAAAALPAAAQGLFDDNEARRRVEVQRQRVDKLEAEAAGVAERLGKAEAAAAAAADRGAILEFSQQLEAMRGEIAKLRGQVEVLSNQGDTAAGRQKDFYVDIDTRLRKLEQAAEKQAAAPPPAPPEKPAAAAADPAKPEPGESRAYQAALDQFKLGNYALAVSAMQGFLVTYPNSALAPNAQYWVGLAYSGQRDYKNAIAAQRQLLTVWPASDKAPDALLAIASAQETMGNRTAACGTLVEVQSKYPTSQSAATARQRAANCGKKPAG